VPTLIVKLKLEFQLDITIEGSGEVIEWGSKADDERDAEQLEPKSISKKRRVS
jgi:hypothetical protein